jgi:hypothetical protein
VEASAGVDPERQDKFASQHPSILAKMAKQSRPLREAMTVDLIAIRHLVGSFEPGPLGADYQDNSSSIGEGKGLLPQPLVRRDEHILNGNCRPLRVSRVGLGSDFGGHFTSVNK